MADIGATKFDKLMAQAFRLAEKGLGYTSPNPPVGAILLKNGEIVGAGYHRKAGLPHAEIEALNKAGGHAKGATLVVTLEPCSHFGKTPPCADALVSAGISKVVCATRDPNPVVSGKGYRKLKGAGIEVVDGVLKEIAAEFYRPYFKFVATGLPYVTLKFAQSLDGRIATRTGHSQWISSQESLKLSHRLRAINDAILIGSGTLKKDNPQLTTRLVKGHNPIRIVLSRAGKFPLTRSLFSDNQAPTYVASSALNPQNDNRGFEVIPMSKGKSGGDLKGLLASLGKMNITTLLVEGGSGALTSFLSQRLADKIIVSIAPIVIGQGINSVGDLGIRWLDDSIKFEKMEFEALGSDMVFTGYPIWK